MRYFTYIAERSIRTLPDGTRVFSRSGMLSRAFIISDPAVEKRLFTKQVWLLRIFLGTLIVAQPLIFLLLPQVINRTLWFFGYLMLWMAAFDLASYLVFRNDLATLSLSTVRSNFHQRISSVANTHSIRGLALGVLGSYAFVAIAVWMITAGKNPVIASFTVDVPTNFENAIWLKRVAADV